MLLLCRTYSSATLRSVSHGPGRVQRAILDLIATPEAAALFDHERNNGSDGPPGPVGVPLAAVFVAVYGTAKPTRAQHVSVHRALRVLRSRGLIDPYGYSPTIAVMAALGIPPSEWFRAVMTDTTTP